MCVFWTQVNKICYRNEQKKAKRARHEREKDYLEALRKLGTMVGEYVGNGQGEESAGVEQAVDLDAVNDSGVVDADWEVDDLEQIEDSSDDAHPLLFSYDCETTGLSIYNDHIIEIAAEVINCPVMSHNNASFSSLVKTSRRIPTPGKIKPAKGKHTILSCFSQSSRSLTSRPP